MLFLNLVTAHRLTDNTELQTHSASAPSKHRPSWQKILLVFGATGQQGGSAIDCILRDPCLSKQYRIRAVTCDASKPAAQKLSARGVDVVQGDANDHESLTRVMQGANSTFIVTLPDFDAANAKIVEIDRGKAIADAAVAAGLEHIIFSSFQ